MRRGSLPYLRQTGHLRDSTAPLLRLRAPPPSRFPLPTRIAATLPARSKPPAVNQWSETCLEERGRGSAPNPERTGFEDVCLGLELKHREKSGKAQCCLLIAAFPVAACHWPRKIRQRLCADDSTGIRLDQGICDFVAADYGGGIAGGREHRHPLRGIMRIGGEHVNRLALKQPLRDSTHALAPESGERRTSHLYDAALLRPLHNALRALANNRISLGLGNDRSHPAVPEFEKRIRGLRRNAVVA